MTNEQQMDRVERIARLLAQPDLRARRESREQMKKLRALVEKQNRDDRPVDKIEEDQRLEATDS